MPWEKGRHSLGLKQLEPDPFEEATKELTEGDVTGGSYGLGLDVPIAESRDVNWTVLQDLDLRGCFD